VYEIWISYAGTKEYTDSQWEDREMMVGSWLKEMKVRIKYDDSDVPSGTSALASAGIWTCDSFPILVKAAVGYTTTGVVAGNRSDQNDLLPPNSARVYPNPMLEFSTAMREEFAVHNAIEPRLPSERCL